MKYILLCLIFLAIPFALLNYFVMPALSSLEDFYRNADTIATQAVQAQPAER